MRLFNNTEKEILRKIGSNKSVSISSLLKECFFTEQSGRALMIEVHKQHAVLFLRTDIFYDENKKEQEIRNLFEVLSLINYLKHSGYISLYRDEKTKTQATFFLQDSSYNLQSSIETIPLNEKGDYIIGTDAIYDINDNLIYKGVIFDSGIFEFILHTTTGILSTSQSLYDLINKRQVKPRKNTLIVALEIIIVTMLIFFSGCNYLKVLKYEHEAELLINKQKSSSNYTSSNITISKQQTVDSLDSNVKKYYYGIDISKWNGDVIEEIHKADSLTFIICKATEGVSIIDSDFRLNWKTIKKKKLVRGAYHFYRINDDPVKQADFFLSTIQCLDSTDIAPIVDIEEQSLPSNKKVNQSSLQFSLLLFLKHIQMKTKRIPIIYTNYSFANEHLRNDTLSAYSLWLAEYNKKPHPNIPKTWKQKGYKIWQKSDSYNINSNAAVDYDVYYGTKSELYK